jgi:hypothetical protein
MGFWIQTRASLDKSKLPRNFAIAGPLVGLFLFAMSWCIDEFNLFHFPTAEQAATMGSFSEPPLYHFLTWDLPMVLCPALFPLSFAAMDLGATAGAIAWILAALINALLYFVLGLIVNEIRYLMARES